MRVRILRACVTMPPIVTHEPSLQSSAAAASGTSTFSRSASRTCLSGCAEMNSPIASFSTASSSCCSNSSAGIGGCDGAANAAAAPPSRRRPSPPSMSKIEPWPICASSWAFWPAAWACSSTASMPLRVAPVEPNAPHLTSASIAFLLTRCGSTRSQKSQIDANGAALLARAP